MMANDKRTLSDETVASYLDALRNGLFGLIEIKLGGDTLIEEGVKVLNRLEERIDTKKMGTPVFRMVLTAVGDFAYRRKDDGVMVCPLGCLAP